MSDVCEEKLALLLLYALCVFCVFFFYYYYSSSSFLELIFVIRACEPAATT